MPRKASTQGEDDKDAVPEIARNMKTLSGDDLNAMLDAGFGNLAAESVVSSTVLDQATPIEDKAELIGQRFIVLAWTYHVGKFKNEFVTMIILTERGEYCRFNDSSTGIYQQSKVLTEKLGKQYGPLLMNQGLRASDYFLDEMTGDTFTERPADVTVIPARTYYLT